MPVYLSHYRLEKEPFNVSPDPDFLWLSAKHTAVLETLTEGVLEREGCLLLTGDIGTGKTILIKRLVKLDGVAAIFMTMHDAALTRLDFCNILATEFGLTRSFERREEFYASFTHFLSEKFSAFKRVLIVIDEAQRLNGQILQEAVELSNVQVAERKPLKVILVGQIGFDQALRREENRGVLQNIKTHCRLEPFTEEETRLYVGHRLQVAGRTTKLFTDDALQAVQALSRGCPRLINIVCDHALLYGFGANRAEIDGLLVRECSRDLAVALYRDPEPAAGRAAVPSLPQGPAAAAGRSWRPFIYLAAAVALLGSVFYVILR